MKKIYEVEFKHGKNWGEPNVTFIVHAKSISEAIKTGEKLAKAYGSEDKLLCIRCEFYATLDN